MITPVQQPLKFIFRGSLEFGNQRTFDMVFRHWNTRVETCYKIYALFKSEEIFDAEAFTLTVPQQTVFHSEKHWRATTDLLSEAAQFAIAGQVRAWCVDNGKLLHDLVLEPNTDKGAVLHFREGRDLGEQEGMEMEAAAALTRAIEKFQRHAQAYERRGYVNYKLGNYNDAHYDFSKSADINPANAEAHFGRGRVRMLKNDWEGAASDFALAVKNSIALQPLYWRSRLHRGESLHHAKRFEEAVTEMKFFLQKNFKADDPNQPRIRRALHILGCSLLETGEWAGAIDAFNKALSIKEGMEWAPDEEMLFQRGVAKQKAGKGEFTSDLKAAAEMGNEAAKNLLSQLA